METRRTDEDAHDEDPVERVTEDGSKCSSVVPSKTRSEAGISTGCPNIECVSKDIHRVEDTPSRSSVRLEFRIAICLPESSRSVANPPDMALRNLQDAKRFH